MIRSKVSFLVLVVVGWLMVFGMVLQHNTGWFGSVHLTWPNPSHPTTHFRWDPASTATPWVLAPWDHRALTVTLPRGFQHGTVKVWANRPTALVITADTIAGHQVSQLSDGAIDEVSFAWNELAASGHRFRFWIDNHSPESSVVVTKVDVITSIK